MEIARAIIPNVATALERMTGLNCVTLKRKLTASARKIPALTGK